MGDRPKVCPRLVERAVDQNQRLMTKEARQAGARRGLMRTDVNKRSQPGRCQAKGSLDEQLHTNAAAPGVKQTENAGRKFLFCASCRYGEQCFYKEARQAGSRKFYVWFRLEADHWQLT